MVPSEELARYIFQSSHFSQTGVKYAAFLPPANGKTSVFRVDALSEAEIWEVAERYVVRETRSSLKARGSIQAQNALDQKLRVEAELTPHYRHANITGWDADRSEQRLQAIELAKRARLFMYPGVQGTAGR